MPIYEYQCAHCGAKSDHLMRLSDPDPTECPSCDQPRLSRVLSAPTFRLAGGGWYETDFKGGQDKKRNLAGEGGDAKPEAAPTAKSDGGASTTCSPGGCAKPGCAATEAG
jgi:putative FmdB family regulatory protein